MKDEGIEIECPMCGSLCVHENDEYTPVVRSEDNQPGRGVLFRIARVAAGMSLREAADRLGISHVEMGEYERGKREPHDWRHIFGVLKRSEAKP